MNVGQILTLTANKFPNRTAIIFENVRFTYQEFNWRANQFANSLLQLGLRKGEKVAVQISLKEFGEVWEDLYDILVAKQRAKEPRESLESVKVRLKKQGKLSG